MSKHFVALVVHKETISVAVAEEGREGRSVPLTRSRALSCLDVYGPRPIATGFGKLWSKGHNC